MKRKRKTALPRLTVLAMSRKELLAFCESVQALRCLVDDLGGAIAVMRSALEPTRRRRTRVEEPTENGSSPATSPTPATSNQ